jgi:hypothetical protein
MYDHDRLNIDIARARKNDPQGMRSNNSLERAAKLTQLSEMADNLPDGQVGFILSELIDMVR